MRASSRAARLCAAALVLAGGAHLSAHRYDELLQASRIGLGPDRVRVEMSLTPGIAVAGAVVRDIDLDGDGVLSSAEQRAYAEGLLRHVSLRVDDAAPLPLALADATFAEPAAMQGGDAAISLRFDAAMPRLDGGAHRVSFRNDHVPVNSVYLANALVPDSPQLTITGQRRDVDQRELIIDVTVSGARVSMAGWGWIGGACALLMVVTLTRRARYVPSPARSSSL